MNFPPNISDRLVNLLRIWPPPGILRISAGLMALGVPPALAAQPGSMDIAAAVESELLFDAQTPAQSIQVEEENGVVTLSGTVESILEKTRAEKLAGTVRGVRKVNNRIKVKPPEHISDQEVRENIQSALLANPATTSYDVEVAVDDGVVRLSGTVSSYAEARLAAKIARDVRGVLAVRDNIEVEVTTPRDDDEIRAEITQMFQWDALVRSDRLKVEVENGVVTLSGAVNSLAEKRRAIERAAVRGVSAVDASDLVVEPLMVIAPERKEISDKNIQAAIESALKRAAGVPADEVRVSVEDGIVFLRGTVGNLATVDRTGRIARQISGVFQVHNELRVLPTDRTSREIKEAAEAALARDPYVSGFGIAVEMRDNHAVLFGSVDSEFEKQRAEEVVSRTAGIQGISNRLDVAEEGGMPVYDPYVDERGSPFHGDVIPRYDEPLTDSEIQSNIESQLWWSPFIDTEDIQITVEDGVATLAGTVDSLTEAAAAVENSYEGGAARVVNDLSVRPN